MRLLTDSAQVIPATGQAMADLMRPDAEELYDRVHLGRDAEAVLSAVIEEPNRDVHRAIPMIHRRERHVMRYFLDGSAHTYYLGNVLEHERHSPVHLAQIGAAAVHRDDDGRVRVGPYRHRRFLLLLDKSALSPDLYLAVERTLAGVPDATCALVHSGDDDPLSQGVQAAREPRSRAAHRANWQMRLLEKALAEQLARQLGAQTDERLILDGSLGSEYVDDWKLAYAPHLGIVKSSWKGMRFEIGSQRRRVNIFHLLAELPAGHRTVAFSLRDGRIATWFVRLRGPDRLAFPLMGTLRVEMPLPDGGPASTAVIDQLSGALLAERSATPYGRDDRWHSHLYPIWLAEQAITHTLFIPEQVLKAAIRWPSHSLRLGA
jgi:hypothetical protein